MHSKRRAPIAAVLIVVAGLCPHTGLAAESQRDSAETAFRDAREYTVRIRTQIVTPFIEDEEGAFVGAGFLVDAKRGWIATNAHVVGRGPAEIQVAFWG
jgi:S1-C subfamily serine protease